MSNDLSNVSDESGPYYWHISSGTIQREPPVSHMSCNRTPTRLSKDLDLVKFSCVFNCMLLFSAGNYCRNWIFSQCGNIKEYF